jgi:hypothetical protein
MRVRIAKTVLRGLGNRIHLAVVVLWIDLVLLTAVVVSGIGEVDALVIFLLCLLDKRKAKPPSVFLLLVFIFRIQRLSREGTIDRAGVREEEGFRLRDRSRRGRIVLKKPHTRRPDSDYRRRVAG